MIFLFIYTETVVNMVKSIFVKLTVVWKQFTLKIFNLYKVQSFNLDHGKQIRLNADLPQVFVFYKKIAQMMWCRVQGLEQTLGTVAPTGLKRQ